MFFDAALAHSILGPRIKCCMYYSCIRSHRSHVDIISNKKKLKDLWPSCVMFMLIFMNMPRLLSEYKL
jgi:uncharacterized protein (DUF1810 family)